MPLFGAIISSWGIILQFCCFQDNFYKMFRIQTKNCCYKKLKEQDTRLVSYWDTSIFFELQIFHLMIRSIDDRYLYLQLMPRNMCTMSRNTNKCKKLTREVSLIKGASNKTALLYNLKLSGFLTLFGSNNDKLNPGHFYDSKG